jgi:hypothetical protein
MSAKEAVVAAKQRLDWAQAGLDAARATVKQQVRLHGVLLLFIHASLGL